MKQEWWVTNFMNLKSVFFHAFRLVFVLNDKAYMAELLNRYTGEENGEA